MSKRSDALSFHRIQADGKTLEVATYRTSAGAPTIVFLHGALGSVGHWKSFPVVLARAAECNALVYSRVGHGHSDGPVEKRGLSYFERQAEVVLPRLLRIFGIERPLLFGHSEGAAIAITFASAFPQSSRALILESPLLQIEAATLNGLQKAATAYHTADLRRRLAKYHRDPDSVFRAFIGPWPNHSGIDPEYFRKRLRAISCPTLALWGDQDEYASSPDAYPLLN
jgi:pimeloyl-ACP methyl ester carboxylesterase